MVYKTTAIDTSGVSRDNTKLRENPYPKNTKCISENDAWLRENSDGKNFLVRATRSQACKNIARRFRD